MSEAAIDKVRASRDGHQYHEAWLARRALGLLLPRDELCGIAVEGLSEEDQKDASAATVEIADATFYFGKAPTFRDASKIEIAQFKYSIAKATTDFVCADATKTLRKFAQTEVDFASNPQKRKIAGNVFYSIYTNRPIASEFAEALTCLARGTVPAEKEVRKQYDQLTKAITLKGEQRSAFAAKISLVGHGGDLHLIEGGNARIVADWSMSDDVLARARLGDLRQLVRKKAGFSKQNDKVITGVDVLAALGIGHEDDLLPTRQAFSEPGSIVEREQLQAFIDDLGSTGCWIVHAAGGVGKTVFAQSVASRLGHDDAIVLFDCFGGGAYRSPLDGRHRPERGLMHIVNELACRGLCDPILPGASDPGEVVRRSIQRFSQAIDALRRSRPTARLLLVIDAADNAAMEARDRGHPSFPQILLEGLSFAPAIDGLVCIATARTERRELAIGKAKCRDFHLRAFSLAESAAFIAPRRPDATTAQVEAVHKRADGNPRVIASLIEPDRSLVGQASDKAELPNLIQQRIDRAVRLADEKGAKSEEVAAFLCALSVLPPPVPVAEMATAFGIMASEVDSFAADLSPLLERTRHGLIFRDEPTETLVRETYGQKLSLLDGAVSRLTNAQGSSAYAARSLPGLLFSMGKTDELRALAFDNRFPPELDSDLAKRAIRLTRLRTAVGATAKARDFSATVDLLVELASLVIVDERGEDYLLANPDLVVGLGDPEALRRLFEVRTSWPGTRHARLTTAYVADADTAEAYSQAVRADEWLRWYQKQDEETQRNISPESEDYASIAFYLLATGRAGDAATYLAQWYPFYQYRVASCLLENCVAAETFGNLPDLPKKLGRMLTSRRASPALMAAVFTAFPGFVVGAAAKKLLKRQAQRLKAPTKLPDEFGYERHADSYRRALMRSAMRMANLRLVAEANLTLEHVSPQRYGIWTLSSSWRTDDVIPWVLSVATRCANEARTPDLFDCLPHELWALVQADPKPENDQARRELLNKRLKELDQRSATATAEEKPRKSNLSAADLHHAPDHIDSGVMPILALARHLTNLVRSTRALQKRKAIAAFFDEWKAEQTRDRGFRSLSPRERRSFVEALYKSSVTEAFTALDLFTPETAKRLPECLTANLSLAPETVIGFVRRLALRSSCHIHAGKMAVLAVKTIGHENDVQRRTHLFSRLARALAPANRVEASALFKRGLTEVDAIGSGDFEFSTELLHFAASLRGAHLPPPLALRLAKICEMNVYDTDKWPWPLTAHAFSHASGVAYLAQIARWHDRDKVTLDLTLPSGLTALIQNGLMPPEIALSLLRLVDPVVMWDWHWSNLVEAVLNRPGSSLDFLHDVLDQFEDAYPQTPYYLNEIRKSIEKRPDAFAAVKDRLDRLEQKQKVPRKVALRNQSPSLGLSDHEHVRQREADREAQIKAALQCVDPTDPTSFETFVDKLEGIGGWPDVKADAFSALRTRVAYADRAKHLEAIVGAQNLELSEKNRLLRAAKADWNVDSPTGLAFLAGVGTRLVLEHAEELLGKNWGFTSDLFDLSALSATPKTDLAISLVHAASTRDLSASAKTWLTLATILSEKANADAPRLALERLLDSGAARLADEIGDGPWQPEFDPGIDAEDVAAGLLWFALGSPAVKARWRAAHAVRAMARFGKWRVVEMLLHRMNSQDAGAFQDRSLPFFALNAQLWLLLAIGRIALDYPAEIERFRALLEAIAYDTAFPHVGMREAARRALMHTLAGKRDMAAKKLRARLMNINTSAFPRLAKRLKEEAGFSWERPTGMPEPEPPFYFDYDFEKYNVANLADVFGQPKWQIEDLSREWISKWAPSVKSMHEFSGRQSPYRGHGYYRPTDEDYHSHGTYLAWHALALVGGKLLLERPVTGDSYLEHPWEDWSAAYGITRKDGNWTADGTGRYPLIALHELRKGGSGKDRDEPTADKSFLAKLVGLGNDARIDDPIVVEGYWSSPDGVDCRIVSTLISPGQSAPTALALATSDPYDMWLPYLEDHGEGDSTFRSGDYAPCKPWLTHVERYEKLDQRDPSGSSSAADLFRPARWIIDELKLSATDNWSQVWYAPGDASAFSYRAWGGWKGEGESENRDSGQALFCERQFLSELLAKLDRHLLLLVKLRRYHKRQRYSEGEDRDEEDRHSHSALIVLVDSHLKIAHVEPTQAHIDAVSNLDQYTRRDFRRRLEAIKKVMKKKG